MAGTNPLVPTQHDFIRVDAEMDTELIDTGDNVIWWMTYPTDGYRFGTVVSFDECPNDTDGYIIEVEYQGDIFRFDTSIDELFLLQERH